MTLYTGMITLTSNCSGTPESSLSLHRGRRLIGIKVPACEPGRLHSALIMALSPDSADGLSPAHVEDRTIALETAHGIRCFAADASSGEILYACDAAVPGKTVKDSRILYGPYLVGVTALPDQGSAFGPFFTLSVGAMCDEKDKSNLTYFLNREL